jgi:hypothetical protein
MSLLLEPPLDDHFALGKETNRLSALRVYYPKWWQHAAYIQSVVGLS